MFLSQFVAQLPKIFERDAVYDRAKKTKEKLDKYCIPPYTQSVTLYGSKDPSAPNLKEYMSRIRNSDIRTPRSGGVLGMILFGLENASKMMQYIMDNSEKMFNNKEITNSISYTKATILRIVDCANYVEKYCKDFLNFCYISETLAWNPEHPAKLTERELKKIDQGFSDFVICLTVVSMDSSVIQNYLNNLPDSVVNKLTEDTLSGMHGSVSIDPMAMNAISVKWNPGYWITSIHTNMEIASIKKAQAELELLTTRMMLLERKKANKPDPKLEKEIELLQDRVTTLQLKLEQEEAGL